MEFKNIHEILYNGDGLHRSSADLQRGFELNMKSQLQEVSAGLLTKLDLAYPGINVFAGYAKASAG